MSSFTDALVIKKDRGLCRWEVANDFHYHVGGIESPFVITVPKGFPTDGASVPRPLWWLWPPFGGDYDQAAALHDWLYRTQFNNIDRVLADAILLEAMRVLGVRVAARLAIYLGVRLGGWWTYRKYRRAAAAALRKLV